MCAHISILTNWSHRSTHVQATATEPVATIAYSTPDLAVGGRGISVTDKTRGISDLRSAIDTHSDMGHGSWVSCLAYQCEGTLAIGFPRMTHDEPCAPLYFQTWLDAQGVTGSFDFLHTCSRALGQLGQVGDVREARQAWLDVLLAIVKEAWFATHSKDLTPPRGRL